MTTNSLSITTAFAERDLTNRIKVKFEIRFEIKIHFYHTAEPSRPGRLLMILF